MPSHLEIAVLTLAAHEIDALRPRGTVRRTTAGGWCFMDDLLLEPAPRPHDEPVARAAH